MTISLTATISGLEEGILRDQIAKAEENVLSVLMAHVMPRLKANAMQRAGNRLKQIVDQRKAAGESLDGLPNMADEDATLEWYFGQLDYLDADARVEAKERLMEQMKAQQEALQRLQNQ